MKGVHDTSRYNLYKFFNFTWIRHGDRQIIFVYTKWHNCVTIPDLHRRYIQNATYKKESESNVPSDIEINYILLT